MTDPKDPEGATPEEPTDPKPEADKPEPDDLGENGKATLKKEREARKAAEERTKAVEARLAQIEADKVKEAEDEAKAKGEFEQLATKRAADLEKARDENKSLQEERDALAARVQAYEDRDRKTIANGVKDLPADLREFDPGDDASLDARMAWFTKASALAAKRTTDPVRGNGRSPESANGRDAKADEAARLQSQRQALRGF
jgi:hypothetical protein